VMEIDKICSALDKINVSSEVTSDNFKEISTSDFSADCRLENITANNHAVAEDQSFLRNITVRKRSDKKNELTKQKGRSNLVSNYEIVITEEDLCTQHVQIEEEDQVEKLCTNEHLLECENLENGYKSSDKNQNDRPCCQQQQQIKVKSADNVDECGDDVKVTSQVKKKIVHAECVSDCDHTKIVIEDIPRFYPHPHKIVVLPPSLIITIQQYFTSIGGVLTLGNCGNLCEKLGLQYYLRASLFMALDKQLTQNFTCAQFLTAYQAKSRHLLYKDGDVVAFNLISNFGQTINCEQLKVIIDDVVMSHPYFDFVKAKDKDGIILQQYKDTVITSILFSGDGWMLGFLNRNQFYKTKFVDSLNQVFHTEDLTRVAHFSYDQFYVLYSKFTSLDIDSDSLVTKDEVMQYEDSRFIDNYILDRIFSVNLPNSPYGKKCSTRAKANYNKKTGMCYKDFVIFVKSEVYKYSAGAVHFWFNVLDVDNDGYLSYHDFEPFYVNSLHLCIISSTDFQSLKLKDVFSELVDTIYPSLSLNNLNECINLASSNQHLNLNPHNLSTVRSSPLLPVFSLSQLKSCHIFPHLVNFFVDVFQFNMDDEAIQSGNTNEEQVWNKYLDLRIVELDSDTESRASTPD